LCHGCAALALITINRLDFQGPAVAVVRFSATLGIVGLLEVHRTNLTSIDILFTVAFLCCALL
jgi:hypothetical protein